MTTSVTDLEKQNLEVHVDKCDMRYKGLQEKFNGVEQRLDNIDAKIEQIHTDITQGQKSMTSVLIGTAGTVIAGLLSTIVVLLVGF